MEYRENQNLEAKEAIGGLPESLWETYSAFANAEGGVILLGVEELPDKSLRALELLDPKWLIDDFLAIVNNPAFVSVNLLTEKDIRILRRDSKCIVAITVPKADAARKPVYIGPDPYRGTYRRVGEADMRCSREEVDAMFAARP